MVGNPASAIMNGGTQFVEWGFTDVGTKVIAQGHRGDASSRPSQADMMQPSFSKEPMPMKDFLVFLAEKHSKVRMNLINHELTCGKDGQWVVKPLDKACLKMATDIEQRKTKNFNIENIAGLVDIQKLQNEPSSKLGLYHTTIYWEKTNRIMGDYPRLRVVKRFCFKPRFLYRLL